MQVAESTAGAGGWSRRTGIIIAVIALAALALVLALAAVAYYAPGAFSPPSSARQSAVIDSLTEQVSSAFGSRLAAVDVRYGREGLTPTFFGEYRLKGLPFTFTFREGDQQLRVSGDRTGDQRVAGAAIGGPGRFVSLATAFHADFPDARAMSYWPVLYPSKELPPAVASQVGGLRPVAVVYPVSDYWVSGSQALGVYAWDSQAQSWELVHRGPVAEF